MSLKPNKKTKTKMKTNTLKAAAAVGLSALLMGSASAQSSVSQPVGYETLNYTPGFNYLGLRLVEAPAATGASVSAAGTVVTVADGVADSLIEGTAYLFEATTGDAAGAIVSVTAFDAAADTVTLADDISGDFEPGSEFIIRPTDTLASVFGTANDVANDGNGLNSTGSFATSDQVWLPDGAGGFEMFAFVQGSILFGTVSEWQDVDGNSVDAASVPLVYTDGVIINGVAQGELVVSGSVKLEPVSFALTAPFNYLSSIFPAGNNLAESELETALLSTGSFATSDQVWLPDGTGGFDMFAFVQGSILFGTTTGWQNVDGATVDPTTISFDDNSGIIINRAGATSRMVAFDSPDFYDTL